MTVETAPLQQLPPQNLMDGTTVQIPFTRSDSLVEHYPQTDKPAEVDIRIYKDGLLIAKCHANGIGPDKLFVVIDPLHYPVNSRLALTFINASSHAENSARLMATVTGRSPEGIELKLDPHSG